MGSGLILLIIVGAWLAVLVPMALRSHEASNALGTVDKFHDAMRVLSRRDGVARAARRGGRPPLDGERAPSTAGADTSGEPSRDEEPPAAGRPAVGAGDVVPRASGADRRGPGSFDRAVDHASVGSGASGRTVGARAATRTIRIGGSATPPAGERAPRQAVPALPGVPFLDRAGPVRGSRLTAAARRRRALAALSALVLLTLLGAVLGPAWLLVPHVLADVLLVAFLVWLRRTASARASRLPETASGEAESALEMPALEVPAPRLVPPRHVAGIPDRMPARSLIDGRYVVVPAARAEAPLLSVDGAPAPARGAQGEPWQPVPVPVPTYVNAPTAPQVPLETTRVHAPAEAEYAVGTADRGQELDDLLERRRAVGD